MQTRYLLLILGAMMFAASRFLFDGADDVTKLTVALAALTSCLFVAERSRLSLVYLVATSNAWILAFSLMITSGAPSYLTTDEFIPYYIDVLYFEIQFWLALWLFTRLLGVGAPSSDPSGRRVLVPWPTLIYALAMTLLMAEIVVSSPRYFGGYTDDFDVGTPLYEVGTMMLAVIVFSRASLLPRGKLYLAAEAVAILLVVFIAAGSGKRLALSFIVLAYLGHLRSKLAVVGCFLAVTLAGYAHGVFRDSLEVGAVSAQSLLDAVFATNQGGAFHAAGVYVRLVAEGVLSANERMVALFSTFIGPLAVPVSLLPEVARLNQFAQPYYPVQGNGGMIGAYGWVYLGYAGPAAFALCVALLARARSRLGLLLFAIVVLGTIRWTLYNVIPLVRLMAYIVPMMYVCYLAIAVARARPGQVAAPA